MRQRNVQGFTLAEMSIVLVITGLVIMIVYPALTVFRQSLQQTTTQTNLNGLMRATAAFVQAHGCLPCPTPASALSTGFGFVRGDGTGAACATCSVPEGIVPFASMGLAQSMAKDGWSRWITMRIDPALAINFDVIPPTLPNATGTPLCPQNISCLGLCQANLPNSNRISVLTQGGGKQEAAVLFISHGKNGYGAYYADPVMNTGSNAHPIYRGSSTACSDTGGYERCNADGDRNFVQGAFTNDPTAPFDDIVLFADRNTMVSYLGNPACQTEW
ncbi:MAG: type II secretion system protein [Bdellovibrionales bacterium]